MYLGVSTLRYSYCWSCQKKNIRQAIKWNKTKRWLGLWLNYLSFISASFSGYAVCGVEGESYVLAPSSNGSVVKLSVQPTTLHHHKRISWVTHSHLAMPCGLGGTRIKLLNLKNYLNLVIWVCLVQFGIDRKVAFLVGWVSKYQVWFFPGFWCPRTQIVGWLTRIHLKQYKWRVAWENSLINYALVSFFFVWKSSRQLQV